MNQLYLKKKKEALASIVSGVETKLQKCSFCIQSRLVEEHVLVTKAEHGLFFGDKRGSLPLHLGPLWVDSRRRTGDVFRSPHVPYGLVSVSHTQTRWRPETLAPGAKCNRDTKTLCNGNNNTKALSCIIVVLITY